MFSPRDETYQHFSESGSTAPNCIRLRVTSRGYLGKWKSIFFHCSYKYNKCNYSYYKITIKRHLHMWKIQSCFILGQIRSWIIFSVWQQKFSAKENFQHFQLLSNTCFYFFFYSHVDIFGTVFFCTLRIQLAREQSNNALWEKWEQSQLFYFY